MGGKGKVACPQPIGHKRPIKALEEIIRVESKSPNPAPFDFGYLDDLTVTDLESSEDTHTRRGLDFVADHRAYRTDSLRTVLYGGYTKEAFEYNRTSTDSEILTTDGNGSPVFVKPSNGE